MQIWYLKNKVVSGESTKEKLDGPESTNVSEFWTICIFKLSKYNKQHYQIDSKQQFSALLDTKLLLWTCKL